jgi:hypothetical protein
MVGNSSIAFSGHHILADMPSTIGEGQKREVSVLLLISNSVLNVLHRTHAVDSAVRYSVSDLFFHFGSSIEVSKAYSWTAGWRT